MYSLAKFCFLCLEGNRKTHNILSSVEDEDENGVVMEEKLKCLFSEFKYFKPKIPKYICNICTIEINHFYKFRRKCLSSFTTICRYLGQLSEKEEEYKNLSIYLQDIKNNKLQQDVSSKQNEIVEILKCGGNSISTSKEIDLLPIYQSNELSHHQIKIKNLENKLSESNRIDTNEENIKTEDLGLLSRLKTDELNLLPVHNMRRHTGEKPYKCDHCESTFSRDSYLAKHRKIVHHVVYTHSKETKPSKIVEKPQEICSKNIDEENDGTKCKYKCQLCMRKFSFFSSLKRHKRIHAPEKKTKCKLCFFICSDPSYLMIHMRKHTGEKPYKCDYCEIKFSYRSYLAKHKRIVHKVMRETKFSTKNVDEENDLSGENKCQICMKNFSCLRSLQRHELIHASERAIKCKLCSYRCSDPSKLVVHMRRHTGEKPFKCEICEQAFSSSRSLIRHKRRLHKIRSVIKKYIKNEQSVCQYCQKVFSSSNDLEKHLIDIHSVKSSTLVEEPQETCSTNFEEKSSNQSELNETLDSSFVVDSLRCEFCETDFSLKEHLDDHFKTQHCPDNSSNPFVCSYCTLSFARTGHLFIHTQTAHKDWLKIVKPEACVVEENKSDKKTKNTCKICMKTYSTPKNLKRHELTHASEKPFKCKFCSYRCSVPSYLEIHTRIHTGEKPFKCEYCEDTFSTSNYLIRHRRAIHKVKPKPKHGPPVCKYCQKEYSSFTCLKRHLNTVHSSTKSSTIVEEFHQSETDDYSNTEPITDVLEIVENKIEIKMENICLNEENICLNEKNICLNEENKFNEDSLFSTSTSMEFSEENIKTESTPASMVFKEEIVDDGSGLQFAIMQPLEQEQYILSDLE